MTLKNKIQFSSVLLISALLLSFCAAYYSIIGIASLFSGAVISVGIMAASLEIAKLITASFLFRYWKKTKTFLKIYLLVATILLMAITSAGIFGYLSYAYQKSSIENKIVDSRLVTVTNNKKYSLEKVTVSQKRINSLNQIIGIQENRISEVLNNPMLIKNAGELKSFVQQSNEIIDKNRNDIELENKRVQEQQEQIHLLDNEELKIRTELGTKRDIITFKFVADAFGGDIDSVVKYFIVLLMLVFDPLAICLLLAYNTTISSNNKETNQTTGVDGSALSENSKLKNLIRKPFEYCIRKMDKKQK